jgi:hypothetical protein
MRMKRTYQLALAALLAVPLAAQAQYCGHGYGYGYGYGGLPAYALIERPHPQWNLFPSGGWTLYPGEAGSGVPSLSAYSHVYGVKPPAAYADDVIAKLQKLGIPRKAPEPKFLGRNPNIDRNVDLPTPKGWLPKDEEKDKEEGTDEPPPLPRSGQKPKDKDDKDKNNEQIEQIGPPAVEMTGRRDKRLQRQ